MEAPERMFCIRLHPLLRWGVRALVVLSFALSLVCIAWVLLGPPYLEGLSSTDLLIAALLGLVASLIGSRVPASGTIAVREDGLKLGKSEALKWDAMELIEFRAGALRIRAPLRKSWNGWGEEIRLPRWLYEVDEDVADQLERLQRRFGQ